MQLSLEKEPKIQQISQEIQEKRQPKTSIYIPGEKNGKWSDDQHMKYIAYIDFYKEKMRSKEKRRQNSHQFRSNEFYKQMSDFIGTRNGLQCRSHHQKLQEKYVYTNKIIAAFKQKFDVERYREQLLKLKKNKAFRSSNKEDNKSDNLPAVSVKLTKNAQIQTDLQGINFSYLMADQMTILMYPQIQPFGFDSRGFFYQPNLVFQQPNMIYHTENLPTKQSL